MGCPTVCDYNVENQEKAESDCGKRDRKGSEKGEMA